VSQIPYFYGEDQMKHWHNIPAAVNGNAIGASSFYIANLDMDGDGFPGTIVASTLGVGIFQSWTATVSTTNWTSTAKLGIYTRNASTLGLINSASARWSNIVTTTNASGVTGSFNGPRILTFASTDWSSTPIFRQGQRYWIALQVLTAGSSFAASWMGQSVISQSAAGVIGVSTSAASQNAFALFRGGLASSAAVPATINITDMVGSGVPGTFTPFIRMDAEVRNYA
jgi:hypothetical protein